MFCTEISILSEPPQLRRIYVQRKENRFESNQHFSGWRWRWGSLAWRSVIKVLVQRVKEASRITKMLASNLYNPSLEGIDTGLTAASRRRRSTSPSPKTSQEPAQAQAQAPTARPDQTGTSACFRRFTSSRRLCRHGKNNVLLSKDFVAISRKCG